MCLLAFFSLLTHEAKALQNAFKKNLEGLWKFELGYGSYEENKDDTKVVGLGLGLKSVYHFTPSLRAKANLALQLESSRAQERFATTDPSPLVLQEAILDWDVLDSLKINIGALSLEEVYSESLISSSSSFPGIKEKVYFKLSEFELSLSAYQTIPTSRSSNDQRTKKEPMPYFFSQSLQAKYLGSSSFQSKIYLTHYSFLDLPARVAEASHLLGNTVADTGPSSQFVYEFDGLSWGGDAKWKASSTLTLGSQLSMIQNNSSPSASNRGQTWKLYASFQLPKILLRSYYTSFFSESDVSPAVYGSGSIGHNRVGNGGGFQVVFTDLGLQLTGQYTKSRPINPNLVQSKRDDITMTLETLYAEF